MSIYTYMYDECKLRYNYHVHVIHDDTCIFILLVLCMESGCLLPIHELLTAHLEGILFWKRG